MRKKFKNVVLITITIVLNLATILLWTALDSATWNVLWKIVGVTVAAIIWDLLFAYANNRKGEEECKKEKDVVEIVNTKKENSMENGYVAVRTVSDTDGTQIMMTAVMNLKAK